MGLKILLKNKMVLYIVLFFAITNLFGYIFVGNFNAVVLFVLIGYITSMYNKNMIIVLLSSILISNFIIAGHYLGNNVREGMDAKTPPDGDIKKEKDKEKKETMASLNPSNINENDVIIKPEIDYASTLESAYDNLDKLLGSGAMTQMSEDSKRLADKQKQLMDNMKRLQPLMDSAQKTIENLDVDKIGEMIGGLSSKLGMFGKA